MASKPPFMDYDDELIKTDVAFHDVVWVPTVCLRFVEREGAELTYDPSVQKITMTRVLQQKWETHIMNRTGRDNHQTINPNLNQWRDVPLEEE